MITDVYSRYIVGFDLSTSLCVEGDLLACRYRMQVTHRGEYMGIPATGKTALVPGMTLLCLAVCMFL